MAYRPSYLPIYELQVTISSAKDLKNVNWRHADHLNPYAVVWVDPKSKSSTRIDEEGDTCPTWNETLVIPLTSPIQDSTLFVDIVHAYAAEDTKPLIGSARIPIKEIIDDFGLGQRAQLSLKLKRPSGRPQGKLEVEVLVREPRYRGSDPYYAPPSPGYPYSYPDPYATPRSGYPTYNPVGPGYGGPGDYSGAPPEKKSGSKFGVGTGLAVGAVAGVLGGLAIAEGIDYVEDEIADDAADKVEDDLGYDDDF